MGTNVVPPPAPNRPGFFASLWVRSRPGELVVFHHSHLFYWWPVWLLGFILAGVTYFENHHLAIVPAGTVALSDRLVEIDDNAQERRDVLVLPKGKKLLEHKNAAGEQDDQTSMFISRHKGLGTLFIAVLLLVITITSVPMRGLWSVFIIVVLVMVSIIFAAAGWWDIIFTRVRLLATHINMSGYVLLSAVLFILWLFNFYLMDRQTYVIFTPGQVRVRLQVGGGETVFDATGMVVQKQRADLFRHWILGFGSGDLIIRPAGMQHPIEMPNVLNVGRVVRQIEEMVKEKVVLAGR
jgi:hypothetical protein